MQKETDWKSIIVVTNEKALTYDLTQTERLKVKFRRAKNRKNLTLKYKQTNKNITTQSGQVSKEPIKVIPDMTFSLKNQMQFSDIPKKVAFDEKKQDNTDLSELKSNILEEPENPILKFIRENEMNLFGVDFF